MIKPADIPENLPAHILSDYKLMNRYEAYSNIHFPVSDKAYKAALRRLKFEELFVAQVRLNLVRLARHQSSRGVVFEKVGDFFNTFYNQYLHLPINGCTKKSTQRN